MPISHRDDWVQIAELDESDHIRFTPAFLAIMGDLGWEAKKLVGHLLGLWYDPFEHLLDYSSDEARLTADQPGEFDRNDLDQPQDVVEYWAEAWSRHGEAFHQPHLAGTGLGLDAGWYRDVLRAKLVSLRLPRRLLEEYRIRLLVEQAAIHERVAHLGLNRAIPLNPPLRLVDLNPERIARFAHWRWDSLLEKHERYGTWADVLRSIQPDFLVVAGYDVLLPIGRARHSNLTILRCIPSLDERTVTIFLRDRSHLDSADEAHGLGGFVAVCDRVPDDTFYVAVVYHAWIVTDNQPAARDNP